jgi:hypothetical protein
MQCHAHAVWHNKVPQDTPAPSVSTTRRPPAKRAQTARPVHPHHRRIVKSYGKPHCVGVFFFSFFLPSFVFVSLFYVGVVCGLDVPSQTDEHGRSRAGRGRGCQPPCGSTRSSLRTGWAVVPWGSCSSAQRSLQTYAHSVRNNRRSPQQK